MIRTIPPQFAHAVITASLHCPKCGYDLQGLAVDGRCPECGLPNGESVVFAVDPDASRLPRLADAHRVGDAVLWLALCMLLAALAVSLRPLLLRIATFADVWSVIPPSVGHYATLIGAASTALALLACVMLTPPRGREPTTAVWRDLGLIAAGLSLFAAIAGLRWMVEVGRVSPFSPGSPAFTRSMVNVAMALAAIIALAGLRNVFAIIGQRSREYRSSRGGRQRVQDIMAALVGVVAGEIMRVVAVGFDLAALRAIGTVVIWICDFMLVVGFVYLLVNAWWLRHALRRPRPNYDQVLLPPLPDDTTLADVDMGEPFEVLGRDDAPGGAETPDRRSTDAGRGTAGDEGLSPGAC